MRAYLVVCAVLCALACAEAIRLDPQFAKYMKDFQKSYEPSEVAHRMRAYKENVKRIAQQNMQAKAKGLDTVYGINKFSDMTPEEFRETYLSCYKKNVNRPPTSVYRAPENLVLSSSMDWRSQGKVSPVKDQGQCGSCWAFSTTEGVESAWAMAKSVMPILAPQQIVDCDTQDSGCNGGDLPTAFAYVQQAGGLENETVYPYTAQDGTCAFQSGDIIASISSFTPMSQVTDADMAAASQSNGPLSVCVDASNWQNYQGGVFSDCGTSIDHCVQAVGWDTAPTDGSDPFWIVRNSWGTDWGESGFIRVLYGNGTCAINMDLGYATA